MEEIELKPCPFCGGEAFSRVKHISNNRLMFVVKCSKCFISKELDFDLCDTSFGGVCTVIKKVVDYWNRRVDSSVHPALWCENQTTDETGQIVCLAHLAESRVQNCPYMSNDDRLSRQYPCSDYRPKE